MKAGLRTVVRSLLVGGILTAMAAGLPARGAEGPELRPRVTVEDAVVTLGDLIANAGAAADTAVFRAPDPGTTGRVSASRIVAAAAEHGVSVSAAGLDRVTVARRGRPIEPDMVTDLLGKRLAEEANLDAATRLRIELDDFADTQHVESGAVAPLELRDLRYSRRTGRFSARIVVSDSGIAGGGLPVAGRASEVVEVPVPVRALGRGEVIGPGDIAMEEISRRQLRDGTIRDAGDLVGMEARRGLRAGMAVSQRHVVEPTIISRNDSVTIVYRKNGLALTVRGRAVGSGARGDVISVVNDQSRQSIEAEILGQGQVGVAMPGDDRASLAQAR